MHFSNEGIVVILIVGLIAGWLASKIVWGVGLGIIGDILAGIVGAFLASWLLPHLHIELGTGLLASVANATIGAVILLLIIRLIGGGRRSWRY